VPPSRRLRRFYGVDPRMQAFSANFYCRVLSNSARAHAPDARQLTRYDVFVRYRAVRRIQTCISESVQLLVVRGERIARRQPRSARKINVPKHTLRRCRGKCGTTGLRTLRRKEIVFWSAGPKCGNYFHAAESGRRCDEMEGRYQCDVLAPYKSGHLDCRMVCF
jgi:hypothetical protein